MFTDLPAVPEEVGHKGGEAAATGWSARWGSGKSGTIARNLIPCRALELSLLCPTYLPARPHCPPPPAYLLARSQIVHFTGRAALRTHLMGLSGFSAAAFLHPETEDVYGRVLLGKGPILDLLYPLYFSCSVGRSMVPGGQAQQGKGAFCVESLGRREGLCCTPVLGGSLSIRSEGEGLGRVGYIAGNMRRIEGMSLHGRLKLGASLPDWPVCHQRTPK